MQRKAIVLSSVSWEEHDKIQNECEDDVPATILKKMLNQYSEQLIYDQMKSLNSASAVVSH